jgi:CoA-transferase family III
MNPYETLAGLWQFSRFPQAALAHARLAGADPVLPSSFAVGAAAQTGVAAAALAACELGHMRGQPRRDISVDMTHAALECSGWFSLDGHTPALWDVFSGLYKTSDSWVRVHANFAHHRIGALRLLGLNPESATRAEAEAVLRTWKAQDFEAAAARAGLVVAALRRFEEWDVSAPGRAVAALPLMRFDKLGDAPPLPLPPLGQADLPLHGLRVLDLTRILAGPVCGRTLATHGADVMLVNAPHLPNIEAIADTSRGKLSCHLDLRASPGKAALDSLVQGCHVFVQGYRPGAVAGLGFDAQQLARQRPGIVVVSLSAYSDEGPWGQRRGFDSLVQTAMGFNDAEMQAAAQTTPRALPMQILDFATGHLMAFAVAAALARQQLEGGSWHVRLSLAQTGQWLRGLGRVQDAFGLQKPAPGPFLEDYASGFGALRAYRHSAVYGSRAAAATSSPALRPAMPPGSHPAHWP